MYNFTISGVVSFDTTYSVKGTTLQ